MSATHVLRAPDGREYSVSTPLQIGRDAACQISLPHDAQASRRHATVWVERGTFFVRDDRSSNGTLVNGARLPPLQPHLLRNGDRLTVGQTTFTALAQTAAGPAPVARVAPANAQPCPHCRAPIDARRRFCTQCGRPLAAGEPPARRPAPAAARPAPRAPATPSSSLARLGLNITRSQVFGFIGAAIGGMILARILPYVWSILDPILTALFGSGPSTLRDGFNTWAMTAFTFAVSFVTSLGSALLFRRRGVRRR